MKILYVAMKYDYGEPTRGLSFEHANFYDTFIHMDIEVIYFDLMTEFKTRGKAAMNARLKDIVATEKPDILFAIMFKDELDYHVIDDISRHTDTVTFNWFCDDHWRFDNYSSRWAHAFNWVSTTASSALPKYARLGYKNVIKTQWACNHYMYKPTSLTPKFDVSFVGQPHGTRKETISAIQNAGINVQAWGYGWENGRLSQDEMVEVFGRSRINLNLSNSSSTGRSWLRRLGRHPSVLTQQIKGRTFEVPGCAGFLLTGSADNLSDYYNINEEIAVADSTESLISTIRFYLEHENIRNQVAQAGYARTIQDHTYLKRFHDIFAAIGLGSVASDE